MNIEYNDCGTTYNIRCTKNGRNLTIVCDCNRVCVHIIKLLRKQYQNVNPSVVPVFEELLRDSDVDQALAAYMQFDENNRELLQALLTAVSD